MTHGVRFFARNSSFGTIAFRFNSRVRRLLRSLLRTAAATFRIGVSRDGVYLLLLAFLFVSTVICFGGFVIMLVVFLLYLMMLTLHWEWGWSALAVAGCYWLSVLEWRSSSVSGSQSHCSQRPWPSFKRIVNG